MKSLIILLTILVAAALAQPVDVENAPSTRIIGGSTAAPDAHKYAAAIFYSNIFGTYFCNGVLISNSWVLTSGSCIFNALTFEVQLGSNLRTQADGNRATIATSHSNLPLGYDPLFYNNDIGLIRFDNPYPYSAHIQRILLPAIPAQVNDSVMAIGWGQISNTNTDLSEELQHVMLEVIDIEDCRNVFGSLYIHDDSICASSPDNTSAGACDGDAGSPLLQIIRIGEGVHPVGVLSYIQGNGDCGAHATQVYTNVTSHLDWIQYTTGIE